MYRNAQFFEPPRPTRRYRPAPSGYNPCLLSLAILVALSRSTCFAIDASRPILWVWRNCLRSPKPSAQSYELAHKSGANCSERARAEKAIYGKNTPKYQYNSEQWRTLANKVRAEGVGVCAGVV